MTSTANPECFRKKQLLKDSSLSLRLQAGATAPALLGCDAKLLGHTFLGGMTVPPARGGVGPWSYCRPACGGRLEALAGYRISSQKLDVNPNANFHSQTNLMQGAEISFGGEYCSPSSRRGPAWLKEGFGQLLAVSQPFPCCQASFLPGTKVLDGLVEPQVPEMHSRSGQILHFLPSATEPGIRRCVPTHRTSQPEPLPCPRSSPKIQLP